MSNEFERARASLIKSLRSYLIGPFSGEQELIAERASERYHVGILSPSGTPMAPNEDDVEANDDVGPEGSSGDGVFALANAIQQSAMGFTFQIEPGTTVQIEATWGEYDAHLIVAEPENSIPGESVTSDATSQESQTPSPVPRDKYNWKRRKSEIKCTLCADQSIAVAGQNAVLGDAAGICVESSQRTISGICVITLTVVNRRELKPRSRSKAGEVPSDENIYQVNLSVTSSEEHPAFLARRSGQRISDPEFQMHELLYRKVRQFAVGHGCAVDWKFQNVDSGRANQIWAEWIPATEVFKASSTVTELEGKKCLDLEFLASATRQDVVKELGAIVDCYAKWVVQLEARLDSTVRECPPEAAEMLFLAGKDNIRKCKTISNRIRDGVVLLMEKEGDQVFSAFSMANAAMAKGMRLTRPSESPKWRPFQIAFLLLALPSTAFGDNEYRKTLDLIWFPTGGGKTEAYLGLTAFTLFFRRLSAATPEVGGGTAVITRYTLRLLTMQQLERAARAIMACEWMRRSDPRLGTERFSIGLFVGNNATPETVEKARKVISGETTDEKALTTLPVSKCPWCATPLTTKHQDADVVQKRLHTQCPNASCDFHNDIPIVCVDEELYEFPPSMIIGTVDKFAMLPWKPRMARLLGVGTKARPPSLIIQDELHLIGDALGTMTGLYETAIDALCTDGAEVPKIVGSTATIRRAESQVRSVFARDVAQFPPSGLEHQDSFFYREDRSAPGRMYVGVHAQGRSPKHTLARLIGTLGQGANGIENRSAKDQFWTIATYFNSLRELGGAWILGLDDVPKYIKAMPKTAGASARNIQQITELTSHLPTTEIPRVLENLAHGIDDEDLDREPVDLLLCTNMISVGVDIDRLGLMIVNGQPKTTAEYIQASSRVGRSAGAAGLVVTLYNWTRPRDRSHYERFRAYHESFYRNVEATSVTPFSSRARDRALHAVLIALLRTRIVELEASPAEIDMPALEGRRNEVVQEILDRVQAVTASRESVSDVRTALEYILMDIEAVAGMNGGWSPYGSDVKTAFMRPPNSAVTRGAYETPQSMRDVDAPCFISLREDSR